MKALLLGQGSTNTEREPRVGRVSGSVGSFDGFKHLTQCGLAIFLRLVDCHGRNGWRSAAPLTHDCRVGDKPQRPHVVLLCGIGSPKKLLNQYVLNRFHEIRVLQ